MIQPEKDARREQKLAGFDRLLTILDELRLNCPWDKKQTLESLRHLTVEEVYELSDSILQKDHQELKKEIGDIMLHLIFYSKIADEQGHFDMADVLEAIAEKMIFRHPHIYGDETVENEEQVKQNWEKLKQQEGKGKKATLEGVPSSLPPMVKAIRIQAKARGTGFDWENKDQVWDKVKEEILEFEQAETEEEREKEFGDLIFSLINYARFVKIEPEQALEKTNLKFIRRFNYLEEKIKASGKTLDEADITTMDQFWDEAKGKGL